MQEPKNPESLTTTKRTTTGKITINCFTLITSMSVLPSIPHCFLQKEKDIMKSIEQVKHILRIISRVRYLAVMSWTPQILSGNCGLIIIFMEIFSHYNTMMQAPKSLSGVPIHGPKEIIMEN